MGIVKTWIARLRASRLAPVAARWDGLRRWLGEDDGSWTDGAPRPFVLFLFLFGAAMLVISLFGDQGLFAYRSLSLQARQLSQAVTELEARERDLARQVEALRSDPAAIERLARQKLGYAKPGETVIQLPRKE